MKETVPFLVYQTLFHHYGDLHWWPASSPFEVMVGAVLTQNTQWSNVEMAIANFGDALSPQRIQSMEITELIQTIRPAGFFNQKALYLKELTKWYQIYDFDDGLVSRQPLETLRKELLSLKGVGPETADSILLYAFGLTTFVIDAYTLRLCRRFPLPAGTGYSEAKAYFEHNIPADSGLYNRFHALIVINAKEHCKKSKPLCGHCPLTNLCKKEGVSPVETP